MLYCTFIIQLDDELQQIYFDNNGDAVYRKDYYLQKTITQMYLKTVKPPESDADSISILQELANKSPKKKK